MNKTLLTQRWKDAVEIVVQTMIKTGFHIPEILFYRGVLSAVECITQGTRPEALRLEALETLERLQKMPQKSRDD